jgi:hypothetical protein
MAVTTTGQSGGATEARWHVLLRPRWLTWHAFVIVSTVGMLLLGDWQLHRAESGNSLSWAYTFEWPLFAAFTIYFWIKSLRDELRGHAAGAAESGSVVTAAPATGASATVRAAGGAVGAVETARTAATSRQADSWDATSWDAQSWDATSQEVGADGAAKPADVALATPADGEAYVARLMAEVQRPGRRRGLR